MTSDEIFYEARELGVTEVCHLIRRLTSWATNKRRYHQSYGSLVEAADAMCSRMQEIAKVDVRKRTKLAEVVWPRHIVQYCLRGEGFSYSGIGRYFGMTPATVMHNCKRVEDMQDLPTQYPNEMEIFNKFYNNENTDIH